MDAPATLARLDAALSAAADIAYDLGDQATFDALDAAVDDLYPVQRTLSSIVEDTERNASYRNGCRHANDPSNPGLDDYDERVIEAAERRALAEAGRVVDALPAGPVRDEALALLGVTPVQAGSLTLAEAA